VVFDEAEGEDRRAQDRMQSVLSLMRASSANDGGLMAKGSAGGSAKTYRIRSCFAFASIGVQVAQQSDRTRVSILGLMKATDDNAGKRWLEFQEKYAALITDDFCKGIRSRTIKLLPVILSNIKTFSNAAAAVIGEQRAGDQVGVLLAGAYSLYSEKIIEYKDAVKWVASRDWDEEKGMGSTRDEVALMSFLLEQMIRIETKHATVERSVGELVLICMLLRLEEWSINIEQANDRLKRMGMKVKDGHLYISNSDVNIQKLLVGTAWSKNHHKILMRIDGAVAEPSERFASGVITRAVKISKETLFPGYVAETIPQPLTPIEAASELAKPSDSVFDAKQEDLPF
jgi:putative DNA primase/helicase